MGSRDLGMRAVGSPPKGPALRASLKSANADWTTKEQEGREHLPSECLEQIGPRSEEDRSGSSSAGNGGYGNTCTALFSVLTDTRSEAEKVELRTGPIAAGRSMPMPHLMTGVSPTSAEFEKVYVVNRTSGFPADGSPSSRAEEHISDSAYLSEDQAYAVAIRRQLAYMERQTGDTIPELRTLVTEKGRSIKSRFEKMREWIVRTDWFADAEVVEYHVQACPLGFEKVDTNNLLEGLDEPDYTTDTSTEETDDEDPEDDSSAGSKPCSIPMTTNGKKRRRESD